ncbi:electron transporter RnfD [Bifidobacterium animalis subsp. lactis]|uniref:electron transporter RnfD n=1 Tax=Bifidobacterium animalis TaxID=28025 RepID=UPI0030CAF9BD
MQFIDAFNPAFRTMGRIGESKNHLPLWVFPYTQARFRFTGTSLAVRLRNFWNYGHTRIGVIIDNTQFSVRVPSPVEPEPDAAVSVGEDGMLTIRIASHLPNIEHRAIVFKREDGGMHYMEFAGVEIDDDAQILAPAEPASTRRIEVYGDSVSCGERNEAVLCTGKADPDEDLSAYSNSWFAYDAIAARALGADLRIISQGGAPLLDGIGWFNAPDYLGMESIWDRVQYNPALGEPTDWDFRDDDPQVVIVALGQNDSHPYDFMAADYTGEQAANWRARYAEFLGDLLERYPDAHIICTTTVLQHDRNWGRAIDEVVSELDNPQITHFDYSRAGTGTPGHPRIAEDEEMARELVAYIDSFGAELWQ